MRCYISHGVWGKGAPQHKVVSPRNQNSQQATPRWMVSLTFPFLTLPCNIVITEGLLFRKCLIFDFIKKIRKINVSDYTFLKVIETSKDKTQNSRAEFEKLCILQWGPGTWKLKMKRVASFCEFIESWSMFLQSLLLLSLLLTSLEGNKELLKQHWWLVSVVLFSLTCLTSMSEWWWIKQGPLLLTWSGLFTSGLDFSHLSMANPKSLFRRGL